MERYDSYKDSGVEWIGDIPSHWSKIKLSMTINTTQGIQVDVPKQKYEKEFGYERFLRISDYTNPDIEHRYVNVPNLNNYMVNEDDIVMFRYGESGKVVKGLKGVICNNVFSISSKNHEMSNNYLFKVFSSNDFYELLKSSSNNPTLSQVSHSQIKEQKVPFPPLSEQQQIVSFLDTKTSLIDSLIEKTHQKIELLKEKRTSLINELVTKGLNPNVEMKDSLVEWIGEIPENWYWKRMCYMFRPVSIKNTSGEMNLSVYRDYGVIPTNSRDDNHNVISEDTSNYKLVDVGDFVMNKMKCWMGSLGLSDYRGIVSPSYTVMKPLTQNNRKYLHYLLRSQVYIPQYKKLSYGVREGQWDLRFEDFRELPCLIPPLSEQQKIVEYLDEQTQLIDNTISIEEKRIELLNEYRQSLISEVVTGKRKVVE